MTMKAQGSWFNSQSPVKHTNKYFGTKKVTIILGTNIVKDSYISNNKYPSPSAEFLLEDFSVALILWPMVIH